MQVFTLTGITLLWTILTILMMTAIMYFLPTMYQAVYRHSASQDSPEHVPNAQNEYENSAAYKNTGQGRLERV